MCSRHQRSSARHSCSRFYVQSKSELGKCSQRSQPTPAPFPPSNTILAWMSLWDRYLAPGDIRRRRNSAPQQSHDEVVSLNNSRALPTSSRTFERPRLPDSHRHRRQNALFYGGIFFTILSVVTTRRALRRRRLADPPLPPLSLTAPPIPEGTIPAGPKVDGPREALEAFALATANVLSIAMAVVGAGMKVWDVADVHDLRRYTERIGDGSQVKGEVGEDMEAWVKGFLGRGDVPLGLETEKAKESKDDGR